MKNHVESVLAFEVQISNANNWKYLDSLSFFLI